MAKRRILRGKIRFISLCPRGKNKLPVIYKAEGSDEGFELDTVSKMTEEGEVLAVVYAPEHEDSDGDLASASVIKQMLYDSARDGLNLDLMHDGQPLEKSRAFVAESFIVQAGDPRFAGLKDRDGAEVDPTGGWGVVVKIDDEDLKQKYRGGDWNGVSMGGVGEFSTRKQEDDVPLSKEDLEKIAEAVASPVGAAVGAAITKALEPLQKKDPPKDDPGSKDEDTRPTFAGDPMSKDDLKAYEAALHKHDLLERLAKAKTAGEVAKIRAELVKAEEDEKGGGSTGNDDPNAVEIAKLQEQIKKLQGRSKQPDDRGGDDAKPSRHPMLKGHEDAFNLGAKMAAWSNKQRGFSVAS